MSDPLVRLREICLAFPEATERLSHGSPTFFVRDKKVFVSCVGVDRDEARPAIWCAAPPGAQEELIAEDPRRFFRPPYVGHRGWLGVYLDAEVDWVEVAEIVEESYRAVAPKRLLAVLDGS